MSGVVLFENCKNHLLWKIAFGVMGAHVFVLLFLVFQPAPIPSVVDKPRRIVVKTVALQPQPVKAKAEKKSPPSKPTPKKEIQKKEIEKVAERPVEKKAQKTSPAAHEKMKKIQESLSKVNTQPLPSAPTPDIPINLTALAVENLPSDLEAAISDAEAHYRDELARRLKASLTLPEKGAVVIKLTISRSGHLVKLMIVSAANPSNRKYVAQTVPLLTLPGFGSFFGGESTHTFTIDLRGD